jgi:foldase protein PrsA
MNFRGPLGWSMLSWTRAKLPEAPFSVRKTTLILVLALLGLGLTACGGGDDNVPDGAVAVVDGEEISKGEFDALMIRAKTSYQQNKRDFPKVGTPEYKTLQDQAVQYLVQQEKYRQKAEDLDVEVSDKEVDERLKQVKQQYFGGNDAQFQKNLKQQGLTVEQVRNEIKNQLISEKIYEKVTEGVKVTDNEISTYYDKHKKDYKVAASRDVRHILVAKKALADDLHSQLENGGSFAALAKKHSTDPSSKQNGGKLTVRKGETVPQFDKVAFSLEKNELSDPVKTQYGWHIIEALSDIAAPKQTPLKDVKEQIRQQLLQEKRQKAISDWSKDINDEFDDEITYQVGYAPPATTGTTVDR